jgi:ligand-binding sensor domain-containing protein
MSWPAWKRATRLCLVFFCLLLPLFPQAATPFSRLWWLNEAHTPVQVNDMLRGPGDALWLATDAGIFRFSGGLFLPIKDTGGAATCLYLSDGGLLAGYRSGRIARIIDDSARTIPIPGGGPDAAVTSFAGWGDAIAFSTLGSGIWGLHRGQVSRFSAAQGLSDDYVYGLQIVGPGRLVAATDRGLNLITAAEGKLQVAQVLREGIVQSLRSLPGAANSVLAGTNEGRWYEIGFDNDGRWNIALRDSLPDEVSDFAVQNGHILVLAGNSTIYVYGNGRDGILSRRDSFQINLRGTRLLAESSGTLWHGSNAGLTALTNGYLTQIRPAPGYRLESVTAMTSALGTLWYAQSDSLLAVGVKGAALLGRMPAHITSLAADSSGIWIGTLGHGLMHMDYLGVVSVPGGAEAFSKEHVLSISLHEGRLWMATLSGLDELEVVSGVELRSIRHHSKHGGLGADYVYQCVPDHSGRMWIATDGAGICRYENGRYRRWTEGQQGFRGRTVYSIAEDKAGLIWAATLENGICRYDGRRWTSIGRAEGLQSLNVSSLAALSDGQVLVVHDQGMDLWQPASAAFRHIGRRQGMNIDSSSRTLNCVARSLDGAVQAPFEDGFLNFIPNWHPAPLIPGLRLLQVGAPGQAGSLSRHVFEPEENSLSFRYEGSNQLNTERLFYRYRLAGFMKDWITTRDESATFARLPAGDYDFEVESSYNGAFLHPAVSRFAFRIQRPVWLRWWAIAIVAGLLILAGLGIIRYRERNIRRIEQLQNARTQMEYEHLKSQINPHFLFNSLNILGTLIGKDPGRAVEYTYALSDLYRNTLHYRDRELIPLEEEWSILMQYLLVQKTRFGAALQLESSVPEALMKTARVVPLALQLLVENAIKHNVVSTSSPLTIFIDVPGNRLRVRNRYNPKRNPEKGTGVGLANIRSRYGLHKQDISYGLEDGIFVVAIPLL